MDRLKEQTNKFSISLKEKIKKTRVFRTSQIDETGSSWILAIRLPGAIFSVRPIWVVNNICLYSEIREQKHADWLY